MTLINVTTNSPASQSVVAINNGVKSHIFEFSSQSTSPVNTSVETMLYSSCQYNNTRWFGGYIVTNNGTNWIDSSVTPGFIMYLFYNTTYSGKLNFKFYAA